MKRYRMGSEEILKAVNQFPFFIFFNPRESKSELNKKQRRVQPAATQVHSGFRVAEVCPRRKAANFCHPHSYIKCPFLGLGASFGQFSSNGISFHHELIFAMGLDF